MSEMSDDLLRQRLDALLEEKARSMTKPPPEEQMVAGEWPSVAYLVALDLYRQLEVRSRQLGIACLKHDLVHALECGACLRDAQERLAGVDAQLLAARREGFQAAMIFAHNLCMDESNRLNADDLDAEAATRCGDRVKEWMRLGDEAIGDLVAESEPARVELGLPNAVAAAAGRVVRDDLAALVRLLVRTVRKTQPDNEAARKAFDYLERHGLQGSPLRVEA